MSPAQLQVREAAVEGRIKRKLLALTRLCQGGKTRIIIADGRGDQPVTNALAGAGTHIS
jgi:acetylglutamate/LysW-gamma-L-alpha-aminoadipate kinase